MRAHVKVLAKATAGEGPEAPLVSTPSTDPQLVRGVVPMTKPAVAHLTVLGYSRVQRTVEDGFGVARVAVPFSAEALVLGSLLFGGAFGHAAVQFLFSSPTHGIGRQGVGGGEREDVVRTARLSPSATIGRGRETNA